jgi:hypothetical protein
MSLFDAIAGAFLFGVFAGASLWSAIEGRGLRK